MARYYPPVTKRPIFLASDFNTNRVSSEDVENGAPIPGQTGAATLSLGQSTSIFPIPTVSPGIYMLSMTTKGALANSSTVGYASVEVYTISSVYTHATTDHYGTITPLVKTTGIWMYAPSSLTPTGAFVITNHTINEPVEVRWTLSRFS